MRHLVTCTHHPLQLRVRGHPLQILLRKPPPLKLKTPRGITKKVPKPRSILKSKSQTPQIKTEPPIVARTKAKSALAKGGTIVITDDEDDQDVDIRPSPEIPLPILPAGTEPGKVLQAVYKVVKFVSHIEIRRFDHLTFLGNTNMSTQLSAYAERPVSWMRR